MLIISYDRTDYSFNIISGTLWEADVRLMILSCHYVIFLNDNALLPLRRRNVHQNKRIYMRITEPRFQYNHTGNAALELYVPPPRYAAPEKQLTYAMERPESLFIRRRTRYTRQDPFPGRDVRPPSIAARFLAGEWGGVSQEGRDRCCCTEVSVGNFLRLFLRRRWLSLSYIYLSIYFTGDAIYLFINPSTYLSIVYPSIYLPFTNTCKSIGIYMAEFLKTPYTSIFVSGRRKFRSKFSTDSTLTSKGWPKRNIKEKRKSPLSPPTSSIIKVITLSSGLERRLNTPMPFW